MLYSILRFFLFLLPAETAHELGLMGMRFAQKCRLLRFLQEPNLPEQKTVVAGIVFPNPIGLAAGMDKNGIAIDALGELGFGFLELGTVTPQAQPGNPKPRLFRLKKEEALINRMGFNNEGIDALLARIQRSQFYQKGGVVGINIGKNASTPMDSALNDYLIGLEKAYPVAHYVAVNISSPNTQNLRQLQEKNALSHLLKALKEKQTELEKTHGKYVPIFIKIAPDLRDEEIKDIAENLIFFQMDGVIATNTTLKREKIASSPWKNEAGGLSGKPLTEDSLAVQQKLNQILKGKIPIIGTGGVLRAEDALAKKKHGAALIQLYSGFVFQGPALIARCRRLFKEAQE